MEKRPEKEMKQSLEEIEKESLKDSTLEDMCRSIVESTSDSIYMMDRDCRYRFINRHHLSRLGMPAELIIGKQYSDYHTPEQSSEFSERMKEVFATGVSIQYEYRSLRDNRYFLQTISPMKDQKSGGEIAGVVVISKDVTRQKLTEEAIRESEDKYKTIIENIEDGYFETDSRGHMSFFNSVWFRMIGYSREELVGMNFCHLLDVEMSERMFHIYYDVYESGKNFKDIELLVRRNDGTRIDVELSVSRILDTKGQSLGIRNFIRDVTERKKAEELIKRLAYHDPLTGLPNRLLFRDRLNMAIARAKRNQRSLAVMMLDLDKFKDVNDTLGHHMGDKLLQSVSERLSGLLRKADTIARMGGDEFLLLLPEINKIEDCTMIAQKIVDSFQEPFIIHDNEIHITTSVGIATYPESPDDVETLLKHADIAMYRAKETGRNNFQRFISSMVVKETK